MYCVCLPTVMVAFIVIVLRTRWMEKRRTYIIIIIIIIHTAIELSLGGSSPYTSTDKTNKNKYT